MKKEYSYEVEKLDDGWIVYKSEIDTPDEKILGYQVELHAHGNEAHRCSCEFGIRQPEGQKIKRCKHVEMVLDEEFRRNQQANHA